MVYNTTHLQAAEESNVCVVIQDETKRPLQHVEVHMKDEEGHKKVLKSNRYGKLYLTNLHVGKYTLELVTPKGYRSTAKQEFYMTEDNINSKMEMTIQVHTSKKITTVQSDTWLFFICACNVVLYFIVYAININSQNNFT